MRGEERSGRRRESLNSSALWFLRWELRHWLVWEGFSASGIGSGFRFQLPIRADQ